MKNHTIHPDDSYFSVNRSKDLRIWGMVKSAIEVEISVSRLGRF